MSRWIRGVSKWFLQSHGNLKTDHRDHDVVIADDRCDQRDHDVAVADDHCDQRDHDVAVGDDHCDHDDATSVETKA